MCIIFCLILLGVYVVVWTLCESMSSSCSRGSKPPTQHLKPAYRDGSRQPEKRARVLGTLIHIPKNTNNPIEY